MRTYAEVAVADIVNRACTEAINDLGTFACALPWHGIERSTYRGMTLREAMAYNGLDWTVAS